MNLQMAAIIRKELIEIWRTARVLLLLGPALGLAQQSLIARTYRRAAATQGSSIAAEDLVAQSLVMLAAVIIPLTGQMIMSRSFLRERANRSLLHVFTTGVNPGLLWVSKVLATFLACYAVVIVSFVLSLAMLHWQGIPIALSWALLALGLVAAPLGAVGVLAIVSFLYWTVRFAAAAAGVLVLVLVMTLSRLAARALVDSSILFSVAYVAAMASMVILAVLGTFISQLSRRRLAGL